MNAADGWPDTMTGTWQRRVQLLADGELPPTEQRRVLQQCEMQPGLWRQLALALLETQLLRRHLKDMAGDVTRQDAACMAIWRRDRNRNTAGGETSWSRRWPILAATVLISVSVGYGAGRWATSGSGSLPTSQPAGIAAAGPQRHAPTPNDSQQGAVSSKNGVATVSLLVTDSEEPALRQVEVPVMTWSELQQRGVVRRDTLPEPLRQLISQSVADVGAEQVLIPLRLQDGRPAVIPLEVLQVDFTRYR